MFNIPGDLCYLFEMNSLFTWYFCSCSVISFMCRSYSAIRGAIILQHIEWECQECQNTANICLLREKRKKMLTAIKETFIAPSIGDPRCRRLRPSYIFTLIKVRNGWGKPGCYGVCRVTVYFTKTGHIHLIHHDSVIIQTNCLKIAIINTKSTKM